MTRQQRIDAIFRITLLVGVFVITPSCVSYDRPQIHSVEPKRPLASVEQAPQSGYSQILHSNDDKVPLHLLNLSEEAKAIAADIAEEIEEKVSQSLPPELQDPKYKDYLAYGILASNAFTTAFVAALMTEYLVKYNNQSRIKMQALKVSMALCWLEQYDRFQSNSFEIKGITTSETAKEFDTIKTRFLNQLEELSAADLKDRIWLMGIWIDVRRSEELLLQEFNAGKTDDDTLKIVKTSDDFSFRLRRLRDLFREQIPNLSRQEKVELAQFFMENRQIFFRNASYHLAQMNMFWNANFYADLAEINIFVRQSPDGKKVNLDPNVPADAEQIIKLSRRYLDRSSLIPEEELSVFRRYFGSMKGVGPLPDGSKAIEPLPFTNDAAAEVHWRNRKITLDNGKFQRTYFGDFLKSQDHLGQLKKRLKLCVYTTVGVAVFSTAAGIFLLKDKIFPMGSDEMNE